MTGSDEKAAPLREPFRIGDFRADPSCCTLAGGGESASIEPKVMDLLALLAAAPGKVFSREDLDAALWPGVTVGEDTLARTVSKLRRALGDSAASPSFIETIPKRGYRLIAPVVFEERPAAEKPSPLPHARAPSAPIIALAAVA